MKRTNNSYPYWVYKNQRVWKKTKRAELKRVLQALSALQMGSAYFPKSPTEGHSGQFVWDAMGLLKQLQKKLSIKEWGR